MYYNSPIQGMVRLPNTDGTSFIQSAWQSSSPTGVASNTTMWFDSTGRMNWNPGVIGTTYTRTFDATGITANRTWTLPDGTTTIAGLAIAQTFTAAQTYSVNGALSAPGQLATGLWQGAATVTAASADATTATFTCKNTFIVGQTVTITGLTSTSGTNLNLTSVTIATASSTQFTVTGSYTNPSTTSGTGSANVTANTATTTKPYWLIEPSGTTSTGWSTSGTGLGINAVLGFTGNLIDVQVNGVSKFKVDNAGGITLVSSGITVNGSLSSSSNAPNSNFYATSNVNALTMSDSKYLFASASAIKVRVGMSGSSSTTLATGESYANTIIGKSPITTFSSGTHAVLANLVVNPLGTVTSGGATVTNTASLYIDGAGSGGTNNYALMINSGTSYFGGAISIGNTVNSVSPTSPNRTITMVIGGTTYYISAKTTND